MNTLNQETLDVLNASLKATGSNVSDFEPDELMALCIQLDTTLTECELDYWLDLPTGEVRIISSDHIDELWTESLIEQIKECYDLSELPPFVAVDWEQTAANCKVDGMGHHFSSYDGEEHNTANFYIFRTN